jgi:hypothetical protein
MSVSLDVRRRAFGKYASRPFASCNWQGPSISTWPGKMMVSMQLVQLLTASGYVGVGVMVGVETEIEHSPCPTVQSIQSGRERPSFSLRRTTVSKRTNSQRQIERMARVDPVHGSKAINDWHACSAGGVPYDDDDDDDDGDDNASNPDDAKRVKRRFEFEDPQTDADLFFVVGGGGGEAET